MSKGYSKGGWFSCFFQTWSAPAGHRAFLGAVAIGLISLVRDIGSEVTDPGMKPFPGSFLTVLSINLQRSPGPGAAQTSASDFTGLSPTLNVSRFPSLAEPACLIGGLAAGKVPGGDRQGLLNPRPGTVSDDQPCQLRRQRALGARLVRSCPARPVYPSPRLAAKKANLGGAGRKLPLWMRLQFRAWRTGGVTEARLATSATVRDRPSVNGRP